MNTQSIIITHLKKKIDKVSVFMKPDNTGKRLTHSGIFQDADDVHLLIFDTYKNKNKFLLFTDIAEIQANKEELNEGEGVDDN